MKVPGTEKKLSTWKSLDLGLEGMEAEGKGGGEREITCAVGKHYASKSLPQTLKKPVARGGSALDINLFG